ncbi:MAG TPA: hypothetical protein VGO03_13780 [Acidimicrobiia bacterium]
MNTASALAPTRDPGATGLSATGAAGRGALTVSDRAFARLLTEMLRRESASAAKPDVQVTAQERRAVEARADVSLYLPDGSLVEALAAMRRNVAIEFERQTGRRLAVLDLTVAEFDVGPNLRKGRVSR